MAPFTLIFPKEFNPLQLLNTILRLIAFPQFKLHVPRNLSSLN